MQPNVIPLRQNFGNYAEEIRNLLSAMGWSQRRAAEALHLPERTFRRYCAGHPCAYMVVLALEYLATQNG